jgi:hypothetical protein
MLVPTADEYAWRWRADDPDTVAHLTAIVAADLLTSPTLDRVNICPGENCAWLFLDKSRSGRRLWCSEETCGMRDRVRRWHTRRAGGHVINLCFKSARKLGQGRRQVDTLKVRKHLNVARLGAAARR